MPALSAYCGECSKKVCLSMSVKARLGLTLVEPPVGYVGYGLWPVL